MAYYPSLKNIHRINFPNYAALQFRKILFLKHIDYLCSGVKEFDDMSIYYTMTQLNIV